MDPVVELSVQQFGAYAVALLLCLGGLVWLARDRARIIADRDAERAANTALSARLVDQAERIVPVLERGAHVMEDVTRFLDRLERDR